MTQLARKPHQPQAASFGALTNDAVSSWSTGPSDADLDAVEEWFVARGLPHYVERGLSIWQVWSSAIPLLVLYYLGAAFMALDIRNFSWERNLAVGVASLAAVIVMWALANVARGRPWRSFPQRVGPVELAVLIVVPLIPPAVLGQWRDVIEVLAMSVGVLALIWIAASYGLLQLGRWAWATTRTQLPLFVNLLLRALPLLLMFTTFLFINAEVWQVAGRLVGIPYVLVVGTFFVLGAAFLLTRTPPMVRRLSRFADWSEVGGALDGPGACPAAAYRLGEAVNAAATAPLDEPLTRNQRINTALVAVFPQALQITVAAVAMTLFFIGFGFVAIPADTVASWTGGGFHELLAVTVDGRRLSLNEPLLRVAGFLGAFTGMYFTVVLATDATYREEFADDVAPTLRTALAARVAYRRALAMSGAR